MYNNTWVTAGKNTLVVMFRGIVQGIVVLWENCAGHFVGGISEGNRRGGWNVQDEFWISLDIISNLYS